MAENLYRADVQRLIDMEDEMILARDIAPIIHVKPDVIIKYVKTGQWDADRLGNYVISGDHVKFFRKDFLQKCGFLDPEKEAPTVEQLLAEILQGVKLICGYIHLKVQEEKKAAGAATPTD